MQIIHKRKFLKPILSDYGVISSKVKSNSSMGVCLTGVSKPNYEIIGLATPKISQNRK